MPTFNYTGRTRISRSRISVAVEKDQRPWRAKIALDLSGVDLPSNARVYFEPYYGPMRERHPLGSVADVALGRTVVLEELTGRPGVLFRIKVVDPMPSGRLLAHADKVPLTVSTPSQREEIIETEEDDLKGPPWRIDFENELPVLMIDRSLGPAVFNDNTFRSLVFPAVLRQVLARIEFVDPIAEEETEGGLTWQGKWKRFIEQIGCPPRPGSTMPEEIDYWIDQCVTVFCRRFNLVGAMIPTG